MATGFKAGFFTRGLALTAGLAAFLTTGLATVFGAGFDTFSGLAAALTADLTTGLVTPALTAFLAVDIELLAVLFALADFAGFVSTVCLLWDAASG